MAEQNLNSSLYDLDSDEETGIDEYAFTEEEVYALHRSWNEVNVEQHVNKSVKKTQPPFKHEKVKKQKRRGKKSGKELDIVIR